MNWNYSYHPRHDLIVVRAWDELSIDQMQACALEITSLPRFHEGVRVLLDFSAVMRVQAQPVEMLALAVATRPHFPAARGGRW